VLAVDGNNLTATFSARFLSQCTGDNERLLIRQRYPFSCAQGGKSRIHSCCADNSIENYVRFRNGRGIDETFSSAMPAFASLLASIHQSDILWMELIFLRRKKL
jgi:hypothetical protein